MNIVGIFYVFFLQVRSRAAGCFPSSHSALLSLRVRITAVSSSAFHKWRKPTISSLETLSALAPQVLQKGWSGISPPLPPLLPPRLCWRKCSRCAQTVDVKLSTGGWWRAAGRWNCRSSRNFYRWALKNMKLEFVRGRCSCDKKKKEKKNAHTSTLATTARCHLSRTMWDLWPGM